MLYSTRFDLHIHTHTHDSLYNNTGKDGESAAAIMPSHLHGDHWPLQLPGVVEAGQWLVAVGELSAGGWLAAVEWWAGPCWLAESRGWPNRVCRWPSGTWSKAWSRLDPRENGRKSFKDISSSQSSNSELLIITVNDIFMHVTNLCELIKTGLLINNIVF